MFEQILRRPAGDVEQVEVWQCGSVHIDGDGFGLQGREVLAGEPFGMWLRAVVGAVNDADARTGELDQSFVERTDRRQELVAGQQAERPCTKLLR